MPKLRGYSNKRFKNDGSYSLKFADEVNFKENKLYISQNCIRHHLFKDEGFIDLQSDEVANNMDKLLCSITGLVRGYVIPATEHKRTSALLLTDFVDQLSNGNFEQMGRSGSKEKKQTKTGEEKSTAMFSKTTFGDTKYEAIGSISIEQIQFISLSNKFSRAALEITTDREGENIAKKIEKFINDHGEIKSAKATYHNNYVRQGSIFNSGEQGILLNDDAIDVLIKDMEYRVKNLSIRQAKGYMYVDSVEWDYNDNSTGKHMLRIQTARGEISSEKGNREYARYFEGV